MRNRKSINVERTIRGNRGQIPFSLKNDVSVEPKNPSKSRRRIQ